MDNWIFDMCKCKTYTLNDLILPGTHNSCCSTIDTGKYLEKDMICCTNIWPISNIIKNWSINQKLDIYTQLNIGVRLFDIDISFYNDEFYTSHTFIIDRLDNLLKQLIKFNEISGDLYVLKIIHRFNITNEKIKKLENIFNETFKDKIIFPNEYADPLNININIFKDNSKNMLIYMDNTNHNFYQIKYNMFSDWPNKQKKEECYQYNKLKLYNDFKDLRHGHNHLFIDLNWILTPTYKNVILNILCNCYCNSITLEKWIYELNNKLEDFIDENINSLYIINSLSIDFITIDIVENIININKVILNK